MELKQKTKFKQTEIGMIPEDWNVVDLSEVVDILTGFPFKGDKYSDKGIRVLRGENVSVGFLRWDTEKRWNHSIEGLDKYHLVDSDIVIGMDGSRVGQNRAKIKKSDLPLLLAQRVARLRSKEGLDQKFLYYNIFSERFFNHIESVRTGTSIPHISSKQIGELRIPLPPMLEQSLIAKILSDLDSKIDLNQQMNKTFEAIGRAIFKHWFIDFEFPNEEDKPYKSSDGEMIYSEELGKKIPKGWSITSLDQVAEFTRGFSYKGSEKSKIDGEYVFVTLNSVKEFGGFKREFSYITSDRVKEKHFVQLGDIVISNTEQTKTGTLLGYPALVEFPFHYGKDKGIFSHHITKVTSQLKNFKHYLYHYLFANQQNAVKYHTGSVIWALDVNGWSKNEKIILPHSDVLREFESLMESIFLKSLENNVQTENLSHIRDSLLPKLMSGKIRVPVEAR